MYYSTRKLRAARFYKRSLGFTLIEVLVAILITALIGMSSWQLLDSTIRTKKVSDQTTDQIERLQRSILMISRDVRQLAIRSIRNEYGDLEPVLSNQNTDYVIELTRTGWRNPLFDQRSETQRVAYEVYDGYLRRKYWRVLDRAQDSEPIAQDLLTDVESLEVRFLKDKGRWVTDWPSLDGEAESELEKFTQIPKAVEFKLQHRVFGEITRLYDLPVYPDITPPSEE